MRFLSFLGAASLISAAIAAQTCAPSWDTAAYPLDGVAGIGAAVRCQCEHDDGSGPALYVGGLFTSIEGVSAASIAKRVGSTWVSLGSGLGGPGLGASVYALTTYDDGTGPALYAGGSFNSAGGAPCSNLAKWRNGAWSSVGSGASGVVRALLAPPSGAGSSLVVGGEFTTVGAGMAASRIAAWNGTSWSAFGSGLNGPVWALRTFDDGSGNALYVGGSFSTAGGIPAANVARYVATGWSAPGGGLPGDFNAVVACFGVYDLGSGPELLAGGLINSTTSFVRLHAGAWTPVPGLPSPNWILSMTIHDFGTGPKLVLAGAGNPAAVYVYEPSLPWLLTVLHPIWYSSPELAIPSVNTVLSRTTPSGPVLTAGGAFNDVAGLATRGLYQWRGPITPPVPTGAWGPVGPGISAPVRATTTWNDGTGTKLVIGGSFGFAGGARANGIAIRSAGALTSPGFPAWNNSWPAGGNTEIHAATTFDFGSGPELVVGGGIFGSATNTWRWNGISWSPLGAFQSGTVRALIVHDDGSGPALYAGGDFLFVAKWSGSTWVPIGGGAGAGVQNVRAFASVDLGQGPRLFAGGDFGGSSSPFSRIAQWDGVAWSPIVPGPATSGTDGGIYAMISMDLDGPGGAPPRLAVAGWFNALWANGMTIPAQNVAAWTGTQWLTIGGLPSGTLIPTGVAALAVFDDGAGPKLYAGGAFSHSGAGAPMANVAKWDGLAWSDVAGGTNGPVRTLISCDSGDGPSLYAGGNFTSAGGAVAGYFARLAAPAAIGFAPAPPVQLATASQSTTLSVAPTGTGPFSVQWLKDGAVIPGATSTGYTIPAASWSDTGTYWANVSNACATATSPPISLWVRTSTLGLAIPSGPGSLDIINSAGIPGATYFTAVSVDPVNASQPGLGWLGGLHIPLDLAIFEFTTFTPPFFGSLDGAGASSWSAPPGFIPASLSGTPIWAVTVTLDLNAGILTGLSDLATLTLL